MKDNSTLGIDINRRSLLEIGFYEKTYLEKTKEKTVYVFGKNTDDCGSIIDAIEFDPDTQNIKCNHGGNVYYNDEQFVNSMLLINDFISKRKGAVDLNINKVVNTGNNFSVVIINPGPFRLMICKMVKEELLIGLKEAKDLIDSVTFVLKENLSYREAESLKQKFTDQSAVVEIK